MYNYEEFELPLHWSNTPYGKFQIQVFWGRGSLYIVKDKL